MEDFIKIVDNSPIAFFSKNTKKVLNIKNMVEERNDNAVNGHLCLKYSLCYTDLLGDKKQIIENQQIDLYTFVEASTIFSTSLQDKKKYKLHKEPSIKSITTINDLLTQSTNKV